MKEIVLTGSNYVRIMLIQQDIGRSFQALIVRIIGTLLVERQTEKYFEFKRVYSLNPNDVILSRVHKCAYLDRSMYDFLNPGDIIGIFKKNNFIKTDAKELIEYLWFTENYNNTSSKVYEGVIQSNGQFYIYYLYEIEIVYGDYGVKDVLSYIKHHSK